jgi:hypothetical protein
MKTGERKGFPLRGYFGLALIAAAEILLFAGNDFVGHWFTPIVWTAYIFFIDALVERYAGRSLLVTDRLELLVIAVVSIGAWWLFELYNAPRFWRSDQELWWHYHNLVRNPHLRRVGYDWAFATIFPAMFLTAELFGATLFKRMSGRRSFKLSRGALYALIAIGALAALLPLLVISQWFVPLVWLSFILLVDPLNYLRGWPSLTGDAARGDYRRLCALLASGGACGVLWEFWNYWAISKWTYTVPYLGHVKLFEMPVLGFLGFPPFAVECWAIYVLCRSFLGQQSRANQSSEARLWLN